MKRARTGNGEANGDAETKSSKDAYMLVYRRADIPTVKVGDPPATIRAVIEAENAKLRSLIESRGAEWVTETEDTARNCADGQYRVDRIGNEFERLNRIKLDVLRALPGVGGTFHDHGDTR